MDEQQELKLGIGDEEAVTLKPATVKIERAEIQELGEKKSKKVLCYCKHPDSKDLIQISSVKYEYKGKLDVAGLWVNLDSKGLLRKGSALATLLVSNRCQNVSELQGKEVPTVQDEKGYLVFKAY